ncbi:MAG: M23 family metallopeptidase [Eubacteriales bacterium]
MRLPYKSGSVTLTSRFGMRTLDGTTLPHKGIDLVGTDKTLVAPCDGIVRSSTIITDKTNTTWEWGNYVRIDTADGLQIFMCHMATRNVSVGQSVKAGDIVGIEGNTGSVSPTPKDEFDKTTGRHCHFEVRKNGASVNPCTYLGIPNAWGVHAVTPVAAYPDTYTHDGLTFTRCKNFAVRYHDAPKKSGTGTYASGGFFANFKSAAGVPFTLPVANLVCDIGDIPAEASKYLTPYMSVGKLRYSCAVNQTNQFKGKKVATLVVPVSGAPYVADVSEPPEGCKYAISGVPTVRNGDDVDYYNYVKPQGWDESCMVAAYRNWLGIRDGAVWLISGKTTAKNYIYGMEFWKKVRSEGFDDIICLDGGGSWYSAGKSTAENRRINNIVVI